MNHEWATKMQMDIYNNVLESLIFFGEQKSLDIEQIMKNAIG